MTKVSFTFTATPVPSISTSKPTLAQLTTVKTGMTRSATSAKASAKAVTTTLTPKNTTRKQRKATLSVAPFAAVATAIATTAILRNKKAVIALRTIQSQLRTTTKTSQNLNFLTPSKFPSSSALARSSCAETKLKTTVPLFATLSTTKKMSAGTPALNFADSMLTAALASALVAPATFLHSSPLPQPISIPLVMTTTSTSALSSAISIRS